MNVRYFLFILLYVFTFLLIPSVCISEETIKGHYCYTYGGRETIQESRELTRTLSIRNGIESSKVFIESTGKVTNFTLTNDLIQIISSGYLKNVKVLEHTEEENTICETISGTVEEKQVEKVIKNQVQKRIKEVEDTGLDNNGLIKILSISESEEHVSGKVRKQVNIKVKTLDEFRSYDERCVIFLSYYDSNGYEVSTDKNDYCFMKNGLHDDVYPDEIRTCSFDKRTGTYKVWLLGGQRFVTDETKSDETKPVKKQKSKK